MLLTSTIRLSRYQPENDSCWVGFAPTREKRLSTAHAIGNTNGLICECEPELQRHNTLIGTRGVAPTANYQIWKENEEKYKEQLLGALW